MMLILTFFFSTALSQAQAAPIGVTQVSDLDFGIAFLGDPSKRVAPGNSETPENASFLVTGDPRRTFYIDLPGTVWLFNDETWDELEVHRFRSRPRGSGRIRRNGRRMVYVGATRKAIPTSVGPGLYYENFTITVVY